MKIAWINKWAPVLLSLFGGINFGGWLALRDYPMGLVAATVLFACACINQMFLIRCLPTRSPEEDTDTGEVFTNAEDAIKSLRKDS